MELLSILGLPVKAVAWIAIAIGVLVVIASAVKAIKYGSGDSGDIFDYIFQKPHAGIEDLPDEITIEIAKENPEKPQGGQTSSSVHPLTSGALSSPVTCRPKGKGEYSQP